MIRWSLAARPLPQSGWMESLLDYRGDYSFEVFNEDYVNMPLPMVCERARKSAVWLAEDVLRRSTPLPNAMSPRASTLHSKFMTPDVAKSLRRSDVFLALGLQQMEIGQRSFEGVGLLKRLDGLVQRCIVEGGRPLLDIFHRFNEGL